MYCKVLFYMYICLNFYYAKNIIVVGVFELIIIGTDTQVYL